MHLLKILWLINLAFWLWFNLVSSPFIILWPTISQEEEGSDKTIWYLLWLNELIWILDIVRKFFDSPKPMIQYDAYEVAVNYIKSTLILDVLAVAPQLVTGLNPNFAAFKIIRLY